MSLTQIIQEAIEFAGKNPGPEPGEISRILQKPQVRKADFLKLIHPADGLHLEAMAVQAQKLTRCHFGNTLHLYAPLYLSNFCENHCLYCGFHAGSAVSRRQLSLEQIEWEGQALSRMGFRQILLVTGESPEKVTPDYLGQAIKILKKYVTSVSLEVYPMDIAGYRELYRRGADGLAIYQETYQPEVYDIVHPAGRKKDYLYRLEAPGRALEAGFRQIHLGVLLGLADPVPDLYALFCHGEYLARRYPEAQLGYSLPRIQPAAGGFKPLVPVSDFQFVQSLLALRIGMPSFEISLSTREKPDLRDRLIRLGITRISAASRTCVGGYTDQACEDPVQFEVADRRTLEEMMVMITEAGYQPVFNNWIQDRLFNQTGGVR